MHVRSSTLPLLELEISLLHVRIAAFRMIQQVVSVQICVLSTAVQRGMWEDQQAAAVCYQAENVAKKQALKKRKAVSDQAGEAGAEKKKPRMWWEDELDGQRMTARDGPEEDAAYFREEVSFSGPCCSIAPSPEAAWPSAQGASFRLSSPQAKVTCFSEILKARASKQQEWPLVEASGQHARQRPCLTCLLAHYHIFSRALACCACAQHHGLCRDPYTSRLAGLCRYLNGR